MSLSDDWSLLTSPESAVQCSVLLVCGIPGSGKSTFSRMLRDKFQEAPQPLSLSTCVISFDDYEIHVEEWDSESFMMSRVAGMSALEKQLKEQKYRLLIVDDIMFYSSMRRKVYQLARKYGASYSVIHVDVPLAVAMDRNSIRPEATRVKDESVNRIFQSFQKPSESQDGGWEKISLTVDGSCPFTQASNEYFLKVLSLLSDSLVAFQKRTQVFAAEIDKNHQKELSLEERMKWDKQKEVKLDENNTIDVTEALPTACLLQALDLKIREVTSFIMKRCSASKENCRQVSKLLGDLKKNALASSRTSLQGEMGSTPPIVYTTQETFLRKYFLGHYKVLICSLSEIDASAVEIMLLARDYFDEKSDTIRNGTTST